MSSFEGQRTAGHPEMNYKQDKSTQFPARRVRKVASIGVSRGAGTPSNPTGHLLRTKYTLTDVIDIKPGELPGEIPSELKGNQAFELLSESKQVPNADVVPQAPAPDATMANMSQIMLEIEHESLLESLSKPLEDKEGVPSTLDLTASKEVAPDCGEPLLFKSNVNSNANTAFNNAIPLVKTNPPVYPVTAFDCESTVHGRPQSGMSAAAEKSVTISRSLGHEAKPTKGNLTSSLSQAYKLGFPNSSVLLQSQLEQMKHASLSNPTFRTPQSETEMSNIRKQAAKSSLGDLKEAKKHLYNLSSVYKPAINSTKEPSVVFLENQEIYAIVRAKNVLCGKHSNPTDDLLPNEKDFRLPKWEDTQSQRRSTKITMRASRKSAISSVYTLNFADINRIRLHDIPVLVKCFE